MPLQRHSYHRGCAGDADEVPAGYEVEHFALGSDEWAEVFRAYRSDESHVQGVEMQDLYGIVCLGGEGVDPGVVAKVRPWVGSSFFRVVPPDSNEPMVYTQRRHLRGHGCLEEEGIGSAGTKGCDGQNHQCRGGGCFS